MAVEYTRDASFARQVLGSEYDDIIVHDGYAIYDQFEQALHQQCLDHAMRRCERLLATAHGRAVCFPRDVLLVFDRALELRDRYIAGEVSLRGLWNMHGRFISELTELAMPLKYNAEHETLSRHLMNHIDDWFLFLGFPEIDANEPSCGAGAALYRCES